MQLMHRWADRNLSRLELAVSLTIILIFIGAFVRHMNVVMARAEEYTVESTITTLNSTLKHWAAVAAMTGDHDTLARLVSGNPFNLLQAGDDVLERLISRGAKVVSASRYAPVLPSANYAGVTADASGDDMTAGKWYYDVSLGALVYRVRNSGNFSTALPGPARIRVRVAVHYDDVDGDGRFEAGTDRFISIGLERLEAYEWKT